MKKLEPGMLCRMVNAFWPDNEGKVMTLIRHIGNMDGSGDWWEVDVLLRVTADDLEPHAEACKLDPINPDHQPADEEWQADFKRLLSGDKQTVKR